MKGFEDEIKKLHPNNPNFLADAATSEKQKKVRGAGLRAFEKFLRDHDKDSVFRGMKRAFDRDGNAMWVTDESFETMRKESENNVEQNANLKKDNEKLKEENINLKQKIQELSNDVTRESENNVEQNANLKKDNEKLKEENINLKQKIQELSNDVTGHSGNTDENINQTLEPDEHVSTPGVPFRRVWKTFAKITRKPGCFSEKKK